MKHKNTIVIGVVALLVGIGAGYFGATAFAHPATGAGAYARGSTTTGAFAGARTGGAAGAGGAVTTGTVAAADAGSITVDTRDGSSHVVLITPQTTFSKSVSGSATDAAIGTTVIVTGSTNSDGSVSANNVQIRPAGSMMPGASTTPTQAGTSGY
jgi:hypothetical protein